MSFDSQAEDRDAEEASQARGDRPHTSTGGCSIRVTNRSRLHAGYSFVAPRPSTPVHARSKTKAWVYHREPNVHAYGRRSFFSQTALICLASFQIRLKPSVPPLARLLFGREHPVITVQFQLHRCSQFYPVRRANTQRDFRRGSYSDPSSWPCCSDAGESGF